MTINKTFKDKNNEEIHYKTNASQVIMSDGKTVEESLGGGSSTEGLAQVDSEGILINKFDLSNAVSQKYSSKRVTILDYTHEMNSTVPKDKSIDITINTDEYYGIHSEAYVYFEKKASNSYTGNCSIQVNGKTVNSAGVSSGITAYVYENTKFDTEGIPFLSEIKCVEDIYKFLDVNQSANNKLTYLKNGANNIVLRTYRPDGAHSYVWAKLRYTIYGWKK